MLTISEKNQYLILQAYEKRFSSFPAIWQDEITDEFRDLNADEKICLKFLLAFMPDQDVCSYPVHLFSQYVSFSLSMKDKVQWGRDVQDEIFLNYVLQYRVNNEDIAFCLDQFAAELLPRIQGLNLEQAVIEVNYWCFEKAIYQSTDLRTISPKGIMKRAYGRCGEESTFFVTALRSVGIPARQVYTPRWAHCDDNHAWVEVWIDGKWHFTGACEPEPVLDSGWFKAPASRGMLIHSKVFSTLAGKEEFTVGTSNSLELNVLHHYADTRRVTVTVCDSRGNPVEGAFVHLKLVNFSEFFSISVLRSDDRGEVKFTTGTGDFLIYCCHGGRSILQVVPDCQQEVTLQLPESGRITVTELKLVPPVGEQFQSVEYDSETQEKYKQKMTAHRQVREQYLKTMFTAETAKEQAAALSKYEEYQEEIADFLVYARGNHPEIMEFLQQDGNPADPAIRVALLRNLNRKDFCDITCDILLDFMKESLRVRGDYSEEIFYRYVLNPRIEHEMITSHRPVVWDFFSENQRREFQKSPSRIHQYINEEIKDSEETRYSIFYSAPNGALSYGKANQITKRMLFVAVCRSLGIPAYINQQDKVLYYYSDGQWQRIESSGQTKADTGTLCLNHKNAKYALEYMKDYSVGILRNQDYETLDLHSLAWQDGRQEITVDAGEYRIITTNRLADGTVLCNLYETTVRKGCCTQQEISIQTVSESSQNISIVDTLLNITDTQGTSSVQARSLLTGEKNVLACLKLSEEPTEHLLNEIIESCDRFLNTPVPFVILVESGDDLNNDTLKNALNYLPDYRLYTVDNWKDAIAMFDNTYTQDTKCPFLAITDKEGKVMQSWSGYNVGIGSMILKYL